MCVKYCQVTPTITYLYFVFVQKKVTEKSLSAVFFLKAMNYTCGLTEPDTLEGSEVRLME